jgi:hypothetical protein
VFVQLDENVKDTTKQLNDINLRLNELSNKLPQGAGPIQFNSNFGDTAALMLTVASPQVSDIDVALRARSVRKAIEQLRRSATRCWTNFMTHSWSTLSKKPRMSASRIHFTGIRSMDTVSASNAACGPRPGLNPYENPKKSSS